MKDIEIIALFHEKSEKAITELSTQYGKLLHRVAHNILNSQEDSEECVNDTFLALWERIPPEKPDHLMSYVCRITRNLAIKKQTQKTAIKRNSSYDIALEELEQALISYDTPEKSIEIKESIEQLNRFLRKLEPTSRKIFIFRYWYGESVKSIGEKLNLSENVISTRLVRIKKKLKKNFEMEE